MIKNILPSNIYLISETILVEFDSFSASQQNKKSEVEKTKIEIAFYFTLKTKLKKFDDVVEQFIARVFFSLIFDILSCLCFVILLIFYYRYPVLKNNISQKKIPFNYHDDLLNLNYGYFYLGKIHSEIFTQFFELLADFPALIMLILIFIFFPWRFYKHFYKKPQKEKELKEKEKSLNVLIDKAKIFKVFGAGVADVIGILVFLLVLCAFWRWNYLFSGLKKIKNNIKFNKIDKSDDFYEGLQKKQTKSLIKCLFIEILKDIYLLLPFVLILTIFVYPLFVYFAYLNQINAKNFQFMIHRKTAQYCCLLILMHILIALLGAIILVTIYRIGFFFRVFRDQKINREKNSPIPNYKRNFYEAHIDFINSELLVIFILLGDIFTLLCFIIVLISFYKINEWKEKRQAIFVTYQNDERLDREFICEMDKNLLIIHLAYEIFLDLLSLIIFIVIFSLILWRIPTFYFITKTQNFQKEVVKDLSLSKQPFELQSKIQKLEAEIVFCFINMLKDIPYIPIFFFVFLLMPWRFFTICMSKNGIYMYEIEESLNDQITEFRKITLPSAFRKGCYDYISILALILLTITIIRLPFLYFLLRKNYGKEKGLSVNKCIRIAFCEMIYDLPYFVLSIIIAVLAPWRIFSLIKIYKIQFERIPAYDDFEKSIEIVNKRDEIFLIFLRIFSYDYLNIGMIILLTLSIYKAKVALKIIKILWEIHFGQIQKYQNYDIRHKLFLHVVLLFEDSKSIFYFLVILILIVRVKSCYLRYIYNLIFNNLKFLIL